MSLSGKALGVILTVLMGLPLLSVTLADPSPPTPLIPVQGPFDFLKPFSKVLSGRIGLIAEGKDPRLLPGNGDEREAGSRTSAEPAQASGLVPYRSPSPKFSRNLILSRDVGRLTFQTEPSIAVNPKDPDHLVVGLIDYNLPNVATYVSLDGGATWKGPFQPKFPPYDLGSAGDPVVGFDRKGVVYSSQISLSFEEFSIGSIPFQAVVSGVVLSSSPDGGFTWNPSTVASRATVTVSYDATVTQGVAGEVAVGFVDKPWMTIGPDPRDSSRDRIYVSYTKFVFRLKIIVIFGGQLFYFGNPVLDTSIEVASSSDGRNWSQPVPVSPMVTTILGDPKKQRIVQGSSLAVAPDGTLYAGWLDSLDDGPFRGKGEILVTRSVDGGKSFLRPTRAYAMIEPDYGPRTSNFRAWSSSFPQLAVGPDGTVYAIFVARPEGPGLDDGDVFIVSSSDLGASWTRPVKINDDNTDRFQFFPSVSIDPRGVIHVMWGDFRSDPSESWYHIYYSRSEDKGRTWLENSRVTDFPSNPNFGFPRGLFVGDYFSIKATENDVYMVWADTRLGEFGALNQKIAFARIRPVPTPSIFVSPPLGPAGQDVIIQGSNFSPDLTIFIEVNGVLVAYAKTDPDGRFTARVFIPISSKGAHSIIIFDASGNTATSGFFTEFGFNTLGEQIKGIEARFQNITRNLELIQQQLKQKPANPAEVGPPPLTIVIPYWALGTLVVGLLITTTTTFLYLRRLRNRTNSRAKT